MIGWALLVLDLVSFAGIVVHVYYARREEKQVRATSVLLERILDALEE